MRYLLPLIIILFISCSQNQPQPLSAGLRGNNGIYIDSIRGENEKGRPLIKGKVVNDTGTSIRAEVKCTFSYRQGEMKTYASGVVDLEPYTWGRIILWSSQRTSWPVKTTCEIPYTEQLPR